MAPKIAKEFALILNVCMSIQLALGKESYFFDGPIDVSSAESNFMLALEQWLEKVDVP